MVGAAAPGVADPDGAGVALAGAEVVDPPEPPESCVTTSCADGLELPVEERVLVDLHAVDRDGGFEVLPSVELLQALEEQGGALHRVHAIRDGAPVRLLLEQADRVSDEPSGFRALSP